MASEAAAVLAFLFKHQSKRSGNPYIFPALSLSQKKTLIKLAGPSFY